MRRGELSVNMNESILRLQGAATDTDGKFSSIWKQATPDPFYGSKSSSLF